MIFRIFLSLLKLLSKESKRTNLILLKSLFEKWSCRIWYRHLSELDVSELDEFSTIFDAQINLNNDRYLQTDFSSNAFEEISSEEADSEPFEKIGNCRF